MQEELRTGSRLRLLLDRHARFLLHSPAVLRCGWDGVVGLSLGFHLFDLCRWATWLGPPCGSDGSAWQFAEACAEASRPARKGENPLDVCLGVLTRIEQEGILVPVFGVLIGALGFRHLTQRLSKERGSECSLANS
jgi:hypothetical protein